MVETHVCSVFAVLHKELRSRHVQINKAQSNPKAPQGNLMKLVACHDDLWPYICCQPISPPYRCPSKKCQALGSRFLQCWLRLFRTSAFDSAHWAWKQYPTISTPYSPISPNSSFSSCQLFEEFCLKSHLLHLSQHLWAPERPRWHTSGWSFRSSRCMALGSQLGDSQYSSKESSYSSNLESSTPLNSEKNNKYEMYVYIYMYVYDEYDELRKIEYINITNNVW